tara:strand:+ start:619 stop:921 length:303 start_codon:yes stop_codon:yes gene_type:complete
LFSVKVFAAEIIQIQDPYSLLIGDNNRTYSVNLSCLEVEENKEEIVLKWMRNNFPRRTRINLRPRGSRDGILFAKVYPIGSEFSISQELEDKGLGKNNCD